MIEDLNAIHSDALAEISGLSDEPSIEDFRIRYLGKKGRLTAASAGMKDVPKDQKPAIGQKLNEVRTAITSAIESRKEALVAERDAQSMTGIDVTLPGRPLPKGSLHPLTQVLDQATGILRQMGFALATGPEIETEWHCFDALNTPEDHPARNESDTFYFENGMLLRTHTSSVQVRTMETQAPPVRVIAPGSAFRRDEIDATHLSAFNQLEGLYVAETVTLGDLRGTLEAFLRAMFGHDTEIRFRPHFFPFTEPSYEIDVKLEVAGREPKWLEMAGCGWSILRCSRASAKPAATTHTIPDTVTGFAFGVGLDRLAMIKWGISDIRHLIENDERFSAAICRLKAQTSRPSQSAPSTLSFYPMNVSLNWLSDHIDLSGYSLSELSDLLTFAGVEVEAIDRKGLDTDLVVVAQVQSSEKHPNADKLSICMVDDGSGDPRQIVCGAKNYKVGDKVALALPGTVMPGSFKIKKGKLRGVESLGMMCSARELGLSQDHDGLMILPDESPVGQPIHQLIKPDTVIEVEVTPNPL